jgi:hypothetical protein
MTNTIATRPADLAALTAAAERAQAQAAEASAVASAAYAEAELAAERIAVVQDARFVAWASAIVAESNETLARLAGEVDVARKAFERAVAAGDPDFIAKYLAWSESGAKLYHSRIHANNLRGHLHQRRPAEYPAQDGGRHVTHDSRSTVPGFTDAMERATATAAAARSGDAEDELQTALEAALRGDA